MKIKNKTLSQSGASAIEFALLLPVLLLFLFGIIEVSILFYNKAMITNASREGARVPVETVQEFEPDVVIEWTVDTDLDTDQTREADLEGHLGRETKPDDTASDEATSLLADFPLEEVLDVLREAGIVSD